MGRNDKCRYQRNCAFSNKKRKRAAWNNLAESDKGYFYNQKKWFEEYEYKRRAYFIVKWMLIKMVRLVKI